MDRGKPMSAGQEDKKPVLGSHASRAEFQALAAEFCARAEALGFNAIGIVAGCYDKEADSHWYSNWYEGSLYETIELMRLFVKTQEKVMVDARS